MYFDLAIYFEESNLQKCSTSIQSYRYRIFAATLLEIRAKKNVNQNKGAALQFNNKKEVELFALA